MIKAAETLSRIDAALVENQELNFRWHLGASLVGKKCAREVWYTFRWAKRVSFPAHVLRIFERGNKDEEKIVQWLKDAGIQVWDQDPSTEEQFRIKGHSGHFGGSLDAVMANVPEAETPDAAVLGEFKTSNEKRFRHLEANGVFESQYTHYVQMLLYMMAYDLSFALYVAINKNNDQLHIEVVERNDRTAQYYFDFAAEIIRSEEPPPRISNSPGWWECRFCDFHDICHKGATPDRNCRTCRHSVPLEETDGDGNGVWGCAYHNLKMQKPSDDEDMEESLAVRGCEDHEFMPELEKSIKWV